jgi:outer membrane lipoprotein-sorting protein
MKRALNRPAFMGGTILFLLIFMGGASAHGQELSKILEGIQKRYGHLPGLTLHYSREVITKSMAMMGGKVRGDLATGQIHLKPPYFLRLEQDTPKKETIITNGETLWWYVPDENVVHEYPARKFGRELRLLSDIFRGLSQVEKSFQVLLEGQDQEGNDQIRLIPTTIWQEVESVEVTVTKDYEIRTVEIFNPLGTRTRFVLTEPSIQESFPKDFFEFSIPDGTKVIREQG